MPPVSARVLARKSRAQGIALALAVILLALLLGMLSTQRGGIAIALIGVGILSRLAMTRPSVFSGIAVVAVFISRFSFDVGGFRLRAEMAVGLICCVALVLRPRLNKFRYDGSVFVILGSWVGWLFLVTFVTAPSFDESLTVLIWLLLNLATCLYIVSYMPSVEIIVMVGVRLAFSLSILGVALWIAATSGVGKWFVQWDPTYGGYAAYVTVFEANILASLVTLWAVIALSGRLCSRCGHIARVGLITLTPIVAIATHTRIALIASCLVLVASVFVYPKSRVLVLALVATIIVVINFSGIDLEQFGLSKFASPLSLDEGTGRYRSATWGQAFADIESGGWASSISGLGANSFGQRHLDPSLPGSGARWYLGNLPLQLYYDGGLVAVGLVVFGLVRSFPRTRARLAIFFVVIYTLFAISTSTLWLMQSWIFLAIALIDSRKHRGGDDDDAENTEADCLDWSG